MNFKSKMKTTITQKCFVCSKKAEKVCSQCQSVFYCSQTCQKKNWIAQHGAECCSISNRTNNSKDDISNVGKSSSIKNDDMKSKKIGLDFDETYDERMLKNDKQRMVENIDKLKVLVEANDQELSIASVSKKFNAKH